MLSSFSTKTLLAAGFALALALVVAVSFGGRSAPRESEVSVSRADDAPSDEVFPKNAFLPDRRENISTLSPASQPAPQQENARESVLSRIQTLVPQFISPNVTEKETAGLPLPEVKDEEIIVSPDGIGTTLDYLVYFTASGKDTERLDWNTIKDYPSLRDLIEQALDTGALGALRAPLLAHRALLLGMIDSLKTVKVRNEVVELHKNVIRYDRSAIALIDKAIDAGDGKVAEADFRDFYASYVSSTLVAHQDFVADSGLLVGGGPETFFAWLMRRLGLGDAVFAQTPSVPFGGKVLCATPVLLPPGGFILSVGPPRPIGTWLLPSVMASPLFFPFKSPFHGAWVLGLSTPPPGAAVIMIGSSIPDPSYIPPPFCF